MSYTRLGLKQANTVLAPVDIPALQCLTTLCRDDFFGRLTVREAPLFEEWSLVAQERFQLLYF